MVGGLDIAAGAAQLISIADLTLTKIIPALREVPHVDENIERLHEELQSFRHVIEEVESVFGLRSIHRRDEPPSDNLNTFNQHLINCRNAVEALSERIPQPNRDGSNWLRQFCRLIQMRVDEGVITGMQRNVTTMRNLLGMWVTILQVEATRESNTAQDRRPSEVQDRYRMLHTDVELLRGSVHDVQRQDDWEHVIISDVEECLDAARSARSIRGRHASPNSPQVADGPRRSSRSADEQSIPGSPDRSGSTNVNLQSRLAERESSEFYRRMIDMSKNKMQQHRASNQFNEAAAAQYAVLNHSRSRQLFWGVTFDEPAELRVLAKLHLQRENNADAIDILHLLRKWQPNGPTRDLRLDLDLAEALFRNGKLDQAIPYAKRAKQHWDTCEWGDPLIVGALHLLRRIYFAKGLVLEARGYQREALLHELKTPGSFDEDLADKIIHGATANDVLAHLLEISGYADEDVAALLAFHIAVAEDRHDRVQALWDAYEIVADNLDVPNIDDTPPLLSAASLGYTEMVNWLLEKGCDRDVRKSHDTTALMEATRVQSLNIVKLLLDGGADPRIRNEYGRTALHQAAGDYHNFSHGIVKAIHQAIIGCILHHGGFELLQVQSQKKKTVIHEAAEQGNVAAITLFLDNGAAIEAREGNRRTPLIVAIDNGRLDAVRTLLKRGADIQAKDILQRTARIAARQPVGNSAEIQALLKQHERLLKQNGTIPMQPAGQGGQVRTLDRSPSETESIPSANSTVTIRSRSEESPHFSMSRRPSEATERMSNTSIAGSGGPVRSPPTRRPLDDDTASIVSTATTWRTRTVRRLFNGSS